MAERGLNASDKRLVRLVGKRVGACLRHQRERGLVRSRPGAYLVWEIASAQTQTNDSLERAPGVWNHSHISIPRERSE